MAEIGFDEAVAEGLFEFETIDTRRAGYDSRLVCGDVVQVLRDQPTDVKYDVVIADPPYNIGKNFGTTTDNMPLPDYLDWTHRWLDQCFRLLSDVGVIYVYGFSEILARIASFYDLEQQRWLVWHYTNKTTPSGKFWQRSHESILCLWKKECNRPTLEIDQIREPYTEGFMVNAGKVRAGTASRFNGHTNGKSTIYKAHSKGALPRDVIKVPALAGGAGASERWFMCFDCGNKVFHPSERGEHKEHTILKHPTQKPMQLTRRLINSRINGESSRVLIPFAGSGSECVVAEELGADWLGVEINPLYVDFAQKWLLKCIS